MALSEANDDTAFPVVRAADIPMAEEPKPWLIDGLWGASAAGVLGGPPKACKSWLALDMAVSVGTATACLGRFRVEQPGPVLIYMAEDSLPAVRERLDALARWRGLALHHLDVHVITTAGMRLDRKPDRTRLLETTRRIAPRLLVLDPLVRIHQVDENHATAVAELLSYLRGIQRQFDLALLTVHHARKNGGAQGGLALRGSSDIWAWGDSNLYVRRERDLLRLSMEHRTAASGEPVALRLDASRHDAVHLEIVQEPDDPSSAAPTDLEVRLLQLLRDKIALTRTQLRCELRVRNQRLGTALARLIDHRKILRNPDGFYRLTGPDPDPRSHSPL